MTAAEMVPSQTASHLRERIVDLTPQLLKTVNRCS
jgi:hypothetical protein